VAAVSGLAALLVAGPTAAQSPGTDAAAEEPSNDVTWEEAPAEPAAPPAPPQPPPAPAAAPPAAPAPIVAPPPIAVPSGPTRSSVELVPELALAWAHCQDGDTSSARCSGVRGGGELGFSAFWRVTPHLAWGGGFQLAVFRHEPPRNSGVSDAEAFAFFLGLMGRAYLFERGAFDPYVQIGIGGGALGTAGEGAPGIVDDPERYEETGAGPAVQAGIGADFFLSPRLKLGPSFTYTQVFVDKIRRCRKGEAGDCDDVSKSEFGYMNSLLTLGVRLSILLGGDL
jgi:hypothetical protein